MNLSTIKKYLPQILIVFFVLFVVIIIVSLVFAPKTNPETALSESEKKLPEISPQPFLSSENQEKGVLVVNSDPPGARVMVDGAEEAEGQSDLAIPVNITPFKSTDIPIGHHNLTAFKKGFIPYSTPFDVLKDKITRIEIKLDPLPADVGY